MQTHFLFDLLRGYEPFEQMLAESKKPGAVIAASGLSGAQKTHLACALAAQERKTQFDAFLLAADTAMDLVKNGPESAMRTANAPKG